jgi:hypothetical protein
VACSPAHRDIEEMLLERGLEVDHSTLSRWVPALCPADRTPIAGLPQPHYGSVRIDETYTLLNGCSINRLTGMRLPSRAFSAGEEQRRGRQAERLCKLLSPATEPLCCKRQSFVEHTPTKSCNDANKLVYAVRHAQERGTSDLAALGDPVRSH